MAQHGDAKVKVKAMKSAWHIGSTVSILSMVCMLLAVCMVVVAPSVSSHANTSTTATASNTTTNTASNTTSTDNQVHTQSSSAQSAPAIIEQPDSLLSYAQQQAQEVRRGDDNSNNAPISDDEVNANNLSTQLLINSEGRGDYNEYYRQISVFNEGLPSLSSQAMPSHLSSITHTNLAPNLETPLAAMEFFYTANQQNKFGLAAYALNLNAIPKNEQASYASELAKKLNYLLDNKGLYLFNDMPDREDGLIEPPIGSNSPMEGVPRRAIKLGYIESSTRKVPIFMERIRVGDAPPIWVFSKQTVLNIDSLYQLHKPAEFERYLPQWLTAKVLGIGIWEYIILLLFILTTLAIGWVISKGVQQGVDWYINHKQDKQDKDDIEQGATLSGKDKGLTDLFEKLTVPLTITISFGLVFALTSGALPSIDPIATATRPIVWIAFVFSGLWLGIRTINFFANRYQDYRIDTLNEAHFKQARKRQTYLSIFRRIFIFTMILGGIWISLDQFADLEGLGTTLLTSAGIAGAILGIAAQPTLGNIVAGAQVAITQPIRIGDTIMLDGIWSEVEDLRYTYAVLKTWDSRRLIVPMKYFVTEVLENWSHTNSDQSSALYIYVDYGANIEAIRQKFIELVKGHELWDKDSEPQLLTTAINEDSVKLRGKLSSNSPQNAWTLECEVREKLLAYITKEHGDYLPVERVTMEKRDY